MATILVVDDEAHLRMLYKKEFENDGYTVITAASAEHAEALIRTSPPDLVILDIELNDSNGLEFLNRLRQERRDLAVVLHSAYATYKSDFQSWLADAYVMKSSDLVPLKEKVTELLTGKTCGE